MKLSVEALNSHYGPAHILFDIALDVGDGEVVALLGRNGAGKSTTFRSIVGLVAQRSGRIEQGRTGRHFRIRMDQRNGAVIQHRGRPFDTRPGSEAIGRLAIERNTPQVPAIGIVVV